MGIPNIFNCKVSIIGLGYVGLPLAVEISRTKKCKKTGEQINREIIGFDLSKNRLDELKRGFDKTQEFSEEELNATSFVYTDDENFLINSDIFIVTVPTPINEFNDPDLNALIKATELIGKTINLQTTGTSPIIIYESTVFPGATEEVCVPILEKFSKKQFNLDFFCGFSPERINPGDKKFRLTNIIKVTSGSNDVSSNCIDQFYSSFIDAGTYLAKNIKVAEAAKVIENTQRDINIALINELSAIFSKMDIDTLDVLDTAATKWNFLNFRPGLVGGHCIGIDPYYLTSKSREIGYDPKMILCGRDINENMHKVIMDKILKKAEHNKINFKDAKLLILGYTFKENCPDIRNTKVSSIIRILENKKIKFSIYDPLANIMDLDLKIRKYFIEKINKKEKYNILLFLVPHKEFLEYSIDFYKNLLTVNGFIYDLKGVLGHDDCIIRP